MMNKNYQITKEGKLELEKELAELKGRRGEVAEKIAVARDFGDLSENAEYDAAREEQGLLETRISEIEDILQHAEIIKTTKSSKVKVGSTVDIKTGDKTVTYKVVGPVEANPLEGKISNESPIGKELMNKQIGDEVFIVTQKNKIKYRIESIR